MELNKFHIRHLGARKIRHGHPVARRDGRISSVLVELSRTARTHDDSLRKDLTWSSQDGIEEPDTDAAAIANDEAFGRRKRRKIDRSFLPGTGYKSTDEFSPGRIAVGMEDPPP